MICFNCRRQIPDGSQECPHCGMEISPYAQVTQEVKIRRYQRWVMYAIVMAVFLGMLAYSIKVYADNSAYLEKITASQQELDEARTQLQQKDTQLEQRRQQLAQLENVQTELQRATDEYKRQVEQSSAALRKYEAIKADLSPSQVSLFASLVELGVGISASDLARIPTADYNLDSGLDSDGDGLSDQVEAALGTDPNQADTDNDGYSDKEEIMNGYSPVGEGRLPIDQNFVNRHLGDILIQVEQNGEAWYLNPQDGKKYFLGQPASLIEALEKLQNI